MSSGQPKTLETKTSSVSQPFGPALAGYENLFKQAQGALGATNNNPFTGQFLAGTGSDFAQGIHTMREAANKPLNVQEWKTPALDPRIGQDAQRIRDFATETMAGKYLTPDSNPFLAAAGEAAIRPMKQTFTDTVLPAITDQAIAQGAYGGSGQDLSQERAAAGLSTSIGDTLSRMYADNYARERSNQIGAAGMILPTYGVEQGLRAGEQQFQAGEQGLAAGAQGLARGAFDLSMLPGMAKLQIDELIRGGEQIKLDNARMGHQEGQTAPWYGLGEMANILASANMRSSEGTSVQPNPNYVDPVTNALKMALGVAGTGAAVMGTGGLNLLAPMGAAMMGGVRPQ